MPIPGEETRRQQPPPEYHFRGQKSKLLIFLLQCIVMFFAISLFLFFLGFAAFVLIHFLFLSNTYRRRFRRNRSLPDHSGSHLALSSFPVLDYNAAAHPRRSDCVICLDSFQEGDECRRLPPCDHLFHANCVDKWIVNKPTCPICRSEIGSSLWRRTNCDDDRLWIAECEEGS
ncbi:hypothetical protein M569_08432, partial [Genlisea aurea]